MKTYLYFLLDPSENGLWEWKNHTFKHKPFYVGVGVDKRLNVHGSKSDLKNSNNPYKESVFNKLNNLNLKAIRIKILEDISQEEAFSLEIDAISHFKRIIKGGILCNITEGGRNSVYNNLGELNPHSKKVYQYDLNGFFIKEWIGLRSIGRKLNINYNTIGDCCRSNKTSDFTNYSAHNFMWFYDYKGSSIKPYKFKNSNCKKCYVYNLNTLTLIEKFNSIKECGDSLGVDRQVASKSCDKKKLGDFFISSKILNTLILNDIRNRYLHYYFIFDGKSYFRMNLKSVSEVVGVDYLKLKGRVHHKALLNFHLEVNRPVQTLTNN